AKELADYVPKLLQKLKQTAELRDVASDQGTGSLEADLVVDRNTASRLGVTPQMIDDTLYDAYGQRLVSTIFTQLNQYHVVLEVEPGFEHNPMDLRNLFIRTGAAANAASAASGLVSGGTATAASNGPTSSATSAQASLSAAGAAQGSGNPGAVQIASSVAFPNGGQVPLAAFTRVEPRTVPITISHQGQFPVITLSFN